MMKTKEKDDVAALPYICEVCSTSMTEEDHNFCDICDECREDIENGQ